MNRFQELRSLFNFRRKFSGNDSTLDTLIKSELAKLRAVDTETHLQWLRLQRELAASEHAVQPTRIRLIPRIAFASMLVAVVLAGAYFYFFLPRENSADTFTTARGQQKQISLRDGSAVTLNYATDLVVQNMQPDKPRLLSLKGEAHFRVLRNETPFIVSTDCAEVRVVGTEFNLRVRDGTLEVAVIHGIVRVSAKDSTLTLTENQMAMCAQNGFPRRIADMPSPDYPGWMQGKLFFNRTSFEAACREIEMRFDITININDRVLRDEIITGTLGAATAENALNALCGLTGKKFRRENHTYTIY
jgi:ferric-dicitrate binding protein FerR (iron transport regulator)